MPVDKLKLAERIADDVRRKYGKQIVCGGVYGSVGRGEDKEFSDIDLIFVTKRKIPDRIFAVEGVPVLLEFKTEKEALGIARNMWFMWPVELSGLFNQKVLFGDKNFLKSLERETRKIPEKEFKRAAGECLVHMMEYLGKIRNGYDIKSTPIIFENGIIFASVSAKFVALLNKKYFTRTGYRILEEIDGYENVPPNFLSLSKEIWSCDKIDNVYFSALKLWDVCLDFAKKSGVLVPEF